MKKYRVKDAYFEMDDWYRLRQGMQKDNFNFFKTVPEDSRKITFEGMKADATVWT